MVLHDDDDNAAFSLESAPDDADSADGDFVQQPGARGKRKRARAPKSSTSSKSATAATEGKKPPRKKTKAKAKETALIRDLGNLSEVAFGIVHEIFSYLSPLDLLNIAHSNKANMEFLYSPKCISIWKAARGNFPGLPECPADMTEPQYAFLAFGKECFSCAKKAPKKSYTIWTGRRRLCETCFNKSFESATVYGKPRYASYSKIKPLLEFLPTLRLFSGTYSCRDTADRWTSQDYLRNVKTKGWVKTMAAKWSAINEHGKACAVWERQHQDAIYEAMDTAFDARVDVILDRLETMGWKAEVLDIQNVDTPERKLGFSQHHLVQKICEKSITERTFRTHGAALEAYMQGYSAQMHLRIRNELLRARIPHLHAAIESYTAAVPPTDVAPLIGDFFTHDDVRDFVVNTASITGPADCAPLLARLPALAQELVGRMKTQLRATVVAATAGKLAADDPASVLELATTAFSCIYCEVHDRHASPLRYPRVLAHKHATDGSHWRGPARHAPDKERDLALLADVVGVMPWNQKEIVKFDVCAAGVLGSVVELCGLDPKTATKREMDELDPIVECLTCNSANKGRMVMRWALVPRHFTVDHTPRHFTVERSPHYLTVDRTNSGRMMIVVLAGEDAETIRARLNEEEELRRAAVDYEGMACARCFKLGNTATLKNHLIKEHGVDKSSVNDDIVVRIDADSVQKQFYAWPPRKEVKFDDTCKLITKQALR